MAEGTRGLVVLGRFIFLIFIKDEIYTVVEEPIEINGGGRITIRIVLSNRLQVFAKFVTTPIFRF